VKEEEGGAAGAKKGRRSRDRCHEGHDCIAGSRSGLEEGLAMRGLKPGCVGDPLGCSLGIQAC